MTALWRIYLFKYLCTPH